jgi:hypothetical protein
MFIKPSSCAAFVPASNAAVSSLSDSGCVDPIELTTAEVLCRCLRAQMDRITSACCSAALVFVRQTGCWFVSSNCSVVRVAGAGGRHLQDTLKEPIILRA